MQQLLCDPLSPQPTKHRVNESKQYVRWVITRREGCTIIMQLHAKSHGLANLIHETMTLNQIINQSVALLPPESYHVTLRGIGERFKYQNGSEYNQHIESKYKKILQLNQIFNESKIDQIEFDFDIRTFDDAPYCGLSLCFKNAGTCEKILRDYEKLVVNELALPTKEQTWHITLGYFYKNQMSESEKAVLKAAVKEVLTNVVKHEDNSKFYCSKPMICSFKDMTHFEPLNV